MPRKGYRPGPGTALCGRDNGAGSKRFPQAFPRQYNEGRQFVADQLLPLALRTLKRVMEEGNDQAAVNAAGKVLDRAIPVDGRETEQHGTLEVIIRQRPSYFPTILPAELKALPPADES